VNGYSNRLFVAACDPFEDFEQVSPEIRSSRNGFRRRSSSRCRKPARVWDCCNWAPSRVPAEQDGVVHESGSLFRAAVFLIATVRRFNGSNAECKIAVAPGPFSRGRW